MEHLFIREAEPGDIIFVNEMHVPHDGFAPALPGGCYVCLSASGDQMVVRTHGLIQAVVYSAKDFISMKSVERIIPLHPKG